MLSTTILFIISWSIVPEVLFAFPILFGMILLASISWELGKWWCQLIWTIIRLEDQFLKCNNYFRVNICKFHQKLWSLSNLGVFQFENWDVADSICFVVILLYVASVMLLMETLCSSSHAAIWSPCGSFCYNFWRSHSFLYKFEIMTFPKIYTEWIYPRKKILVLHKFMVLGPIFRQVVGSKFYSISNLLKSACIICCWIANYLEITNMGVILLCIQHKKQH